MRGHRSSVIVIGLGVLIAGAIGVAAFTGLGPWAQVDDSHRTTSLGTGTFEFDQPAEAAIIASFRSTAPGDSALKIDFLFTPSGGSENYDSTSEVTRNQSGPLQVTGALASAEFSSGDQIKAVFRAYNGTGGQTFSFTRTYTVP